MKQQLLTTLQSIARCELDGDKSKMVKNATYMDQRTLINQVFRNGNYGTGQVILRLTVIDSLYSTNAAYSYFSFEEMADRICRIGDESAAQDYFYRLALTGEDRLQLFSEAYGIQKNLAGGSKQMSLLSKYAYYALQQNCDRYPLGFPIYDRLAKEAYPTVCKMLGVKPVHRLPSLDTPAVNTYIECLNQLRTELFGDSQTLFYGYQQFDILDAYLWRMGKFEDGNLSLLLGWKDYELFVKNLGLNILNQEDDDHYRTRMAKTFKDTPAVGKGGKFDFGKAVVTLCSLPETKPFRGISNEQYLNDLRQHWLLFHQIKNTR